MLLRACAGLLFIVLVVPVTAESQEMAHTLEQLQSARLLKPGDAVFVTDASGRRTRAKIVDLSSASLTVIEARTTRTLTEADVERIERRDSIENGLWIGLAAGVGTMVVSCKTDSDPEHCVYYVAYFGLPALAGGAVLGALFDASVHRTLYVAPVRTESMRLAMWPMLSNTHVGALVSVSW